MQLETASRYSQKGSKKKQLNTSCMNDQAVWPQAFFFFFPTKVTFMRIMKYLCAYLWWALYNYVEAKQQKRLDEEFIRGLRCVLMFQ